MIPRSLHETRAWAKNRLAGEAEPPWAWYQLMKLVEAIDAIDAGQSVVTTESSPQSERRPGEHLRLVETTDPQDTVQPRPGSQHLQLPM